MQTTETRVIEGEPVASFSRGAMTQAVRLMAPFGSGAAARSELLSVPATWSTFVDGSGQAVPVPRLRSIRKRGVTPAYPRPTRFGGMVEGTLVVFPNGLVLEPKDRRNPCTNIAESGVLAAAFYSDAFELWLSQRERLLVRTEPVDHVDSIFQAYFWNPVP